MNRAKPDAMEIGQCFIELRKPTGNQGAGFASPEAKLQALSIIAQNGNPGYIWHLIPFLKENPIQQEVCDAIVVLFRKIKNKKDFYPFLKHCPLTKADLDHYFRYFQGEQFFTLLAIASLNGSGFVRERAVEMLSVSGDPKAIQFLIYRMADWVSSVRQAALLGLTNYRKPEFLGALVENLELLDWIQEVERVDLSRFYTAMMNFITRQNRAYVLDHFTEYPDKLRIILASYMARDLGEGTREIELFMQDRHFQIRMLVLDHFGKLSPENTGRLLHDKSASVRLQALYRLKNSPEFEALIRNYLADSSAAIRNFARFSLKLTRPQYAEIYQENLRQNLQIEGSLWGLAEVKALESASLVAGFLQHEKARVRKMALLALIKLDEEKAFSLALENLDSNQPGLRNVAIEFLAGMPREEVLSKARRCFREGKRTVQLSMVKLFYKIGGWNVLADLIEGTIHPDEGVRNLSLRHLQAWKKRAVTLFSRPGPDELERIRESLKMAQKAHQENQYFRENPLTGLEFYFR
ncbi:MAG: HEAT repeat domain-containing protein [Bacteroidia bacterium]|nr:HEAT repeat domain-containing protein [Bacteroidia bacterium]